MARAQHADKPIDVAIFGATGFTGRLVAEYFAARYGKESGVVWAMAGRNAEKLAAVRDEIGAPSDTPLMKADAADPTSLKTVAEAAKVILTTVGPYQLYGEPLLEVCTQTGADYVDLCGEPAWMAQMIAKYDAAAKASGARIVFSCGFDSIPFDMGVYFLQQAAKQRFGAPCAKVDGRVRAMKGTFSGGTAASLQATMAAAGKDPSVFELLKSPFALTPGFEGPRQPSGAKPMLDETLGLWVAPFVMAPINTKNVHRSNLLLGHAYGADFQYSEMMITGPGEKGEAIAKAPPPEAAMMGDKAPKPGEGPSKEERESGYYDVLFIGAGPEGGEIRASVKGDKDPGYGSTSKMIAEAALCLIQDRHDGPGGVLTAAPALGEPLIDRLQKNAGLTFALE